MGAGATEQRDGDATARRVPRSPARVCRFGFARPQRTHAACFDGACSTQQCPLPRGWGVPGRLGACTPGGRACRHPWRTRVTACVGMHAHACMRAGQGKKLAALHRAPPQQRVRPTCQRDRQAAGKGGGGGAARKHACPRHLDGCRLEADARARDAGAARQRPIHGHHPQRGAHAAGELHREAGWDVHVRAGGRDRAARPSCGAAPAAAGDGCGREGHLRQMNMHALLLLGAMVGCPQRAWTRTFRLGRWAWDP